MADTPKPRDPAAHARSRGELRQRVVRDRKKHSKGDRAREKAKMKKENEVND